MSARIFSEAEVAMIREMRAASAPLEAIREALRCGHESLRRIMNELGLEIPFPGSPSAWTAAEDEAIKKRVPTGVTVADLARLLNRPLTSVRERVKHHGLHHHVARKFKVVEPVIEKQDWDRTGAEALPVFHPLMVQIYRDAGLPV